MNNRSTFQSSIDTCMLPLALAREFLRRHNPFGDKNKSSFSKRKWFSGVRKFAEVNEGVYIGSTPSLKGLKNLRKHGIKTIVNLRASFDYGKTAQSLGFRYITIPLNGKRPPAEKQISEFLKAVDDPDNLPLFFHCNRARNRTYMVLSLYRIAHDRWSADQAIAEMNHFGYKSIPEEVTSFLRHFANGGLKKYR